MENKMKGWAVIAGVLFILSFQSAAATALEQVDLSWGAGGATAVSADYDGDGLADPALYIESAGTWNVLLSSQSYAEQAALFGGLGWRPVAGDFDGDGKTDLTVYREATGEWLAGLSGSGYQSQPAILGGPGYSPAVADYDGDGITELAVYGAANHKWHIWRHGEPEVADPNVLAAMFAAAITDAHNPTYAKIARTLSPIADYNTNLYWSNGLVLVATFTRTYDYPQHIGGLYTNKFADSWVTLVPEAKNFFQTYTGTNCLLRYKQLLGMPPTAGNDMVAEFWVNPNLLFRPSPDPEINDREALLDFAYTNSARLAVSPTHYAWFTNQVAVNTWPWTRLGYTYDWGNSRSHVGLSEFVIPQGSVFIVNSLTEAVTYLTP